MTEEISTEPLNTENTPTSDTQENSGINASVSIPETIELEIRLKSLKTLQNTIWQKKLHRQLFIMQMEKGFPNEF